MRALLEDQAGHLWVGTAGGLELLDRPPGRFSHYQHDASDAGSLRDSFIMSLYQDAAGLVWIGTRAGGVSRWNPRSWELGGHRPGGSATSWSPHSPTRPITRSGSPHWAADSPCTTLRPAGATDIDAIAGRRNAIGDLRA